MRWFPMTILVLACAGPARGQDIVDVLRHSQQRRLDTMVAAAPGPRADLVRQTFDRLREAIGLDIPVDLHVISGSTIAETLHGHIVVANEGLADLPESTRVFVLAHELGHVARRHWLQMGLLYKRWVPGEVTPENTEPVANAMGREASGLAHRQEFEADAFALRVMQQLGRPPEEAISAFIRLGNCAETVTHPSTRRRVAALRMQAQRLPEP